MTPRSTSGTEANDPQLRTLVRILLILVLALLVSQLWFRLPKDPQKLDPSAQPRIVTDRGNLASDEQATINLFQTASTSVVYITTSSIRRYNFNLFEIPQGTGSGFIWDDNGHIVTNFHVIEGASRFKVTLADKSTRQATVVGTASKKCVECRFCCRCWRCRASAAYDGRGLCRGEGG